MTSNFDLIAETPLDTPTLVTPIVALGWGSKETQFHGSEGKGAARTETKQVVGPPYWDDRKARVSWRGDGDIYAVSYIQSETKTRRVCVIDRQGSVRSISEGISALESPLSWRPSGGLIATSVTSADKHEIAFIEKNGLRHGGFALPFPPGRVEVVEVRWSPDSSVMCVWVRELRDGKVECGLKEGNEDCKFGSTDRVSSDKAGKVGTEIDCGLKEEIEEEGLNKEVDGRKEGESEGLTKQEERKELGFDCKERENEERLDLQDEEGTCDIVQLWVTGNYHWYLKREIRLTVDAKRNSNSTNERLMSMTWSDEMSEVLTLQLLTTTHHHALSFAHHTTHTHGLSPQDQAIVAVIDGMDLLVTPFRYMTVPPPMSAYKVTFQDSINTLAFCLTDVGSDADVDDSGFLDVCEDVGVGPNALLAQHGTDEITILAPATQESLGSTPASNPKIVVTPAVGNGFRTSVRPLGVLGQLTVTWPGDLTPRPATVSEIYHWSWPRKDLIFGVFTLDCCYVVVFELKVDSLSLVARVVMPVEDSILAIAALPSMAILQLANGALLKFNLATYDFDLEPFVLDGREVQYPAICQRLCLCAIDGGAAILPLGLTPRGQLYLGHNQILSNCTSVFTHTHHLLATTTAHTLLAIPLTTTAMSTTDDAMGVRRIERGARIVCGVATDTRVILQMPRGNLEVISPRPLAIHALARLLDLKHYAAALELARKHRVDTNLLYDHNPSQFLATTEVFVRDVNDWQRIDVFLASLSETDTSTTTYAFQYPNRTPRTPQGKVRAICEAVREAMVAVDEDKHLLPILTSLVKSGEMESALVKVWEKGQSEDGLRHLLYLADTEELYRVALGTYNLSMALMVAQRSTKDPKEYLPQLNGLRELDDRTMRFRINVLLRRFEMALSDLDDMAPHAHEAIELIKAETLYAMALKTLPAKSQIKTAVCELYGQHLLARNRHTEAAMMLGRAGQFHKAMEAYQVAGEWQMALVMAVKVGLGKDKTTQLCNDIAGKLKDDGRYSDAAKIYEGHLANEEEAIECLAMAGEWADAFRLAHKHDRYDLIQTNIEPAILNQTKITVTQIRETLDSIAVKTDRLALVRADRERRRSDVLVDTTEDNAIDSDLYSDSSTVTGISKHRSSVSGTTKSHRSSKSRRKLERKKHSTKEGSAHEDLGIISVLHETYTNLNAQATNVLNLTTALVQLTHDSEALILQCDFARLIQLAEGRKHDIWPSGKVNSHEFGPEMTAEKAVEIVKSKEGQVGSWAMERMSDLDPHLRLPPTLPKESAWKLNLLTS